MKKIANKPEQELAPVVEKFKKILNFIKNTSNIRLSVVTDEKGYDNTTQHLEKLIAAIPSRQHEFITSSIDFTFDSDTTKTYFPLPMAVNYLSECRRTVVFTHEHAPKLQIIGQIMTNAYLHSTVREKGGAYGTGASNSDGVFYYIFI